LSERALIDGTNPYRILLADESPIFRRGLHQLLSLQADLIVCGETAEREGLLKLVAEEKPNLVIMDLTMPLLDEFRVIRVIHQTTPPTQILVYTSHSTEGFIRGTVSAGADAYVLKSDSDSDLLFAIGQLRRNKPFFTAEVLRSMTKAFIESSNENALSENGLTEREIAIVRLLAQGNGNKEVAFKLNVSTRTVESHRNNIMRKKKFNSLSDLVRFAVRSKLVEP
jgi:DNA-binding NarL/FixJ family response regulator